VETKYEYKYSPFSWFSYFLLTVTRELSGLSGLASCLHASMQLKTVFTQHFLIWLQGSICSRIWLCFWENPPLIRSQVQQKLVPIGQLDLCNQASIYMQM